MDPNKIQNKHLKEIKEKLDPTEILEFIYRFYGDNYFPIKKIVFNWDEDINYTIGNLIEDCIRSEKDKRKRNSKAS